MESRMELFQADCLDHLKSIASESIQCCVTSPPYWGLRDYGIIGKAWGGDAACAHEWGDSIEVNATNHVDKRRWNHARNGRGEDQPVEKLPGWKRQAIVQGKFCQKCGAWFGALGLEPTPQLYVANMVLIFREVRRVLKKDGTLWLNLGDSYNAGRDGGHAGGTTGLSRPEIAPRRSGVNAHGLKPKDLVGIPWMVVFALRDDGWYLRQDIIWHKPNAMPESVRDRCTKSHEYIFLLSKSARYYYDAKAIAEPAAYAGQMRGGSSSRYEQNDAGMDCKVYDERNKRSVWTVAAEPYPDAHFATYPESLIKPCILAGSRVGDKVLDPFAGAGTTGLVALKHERKFIGIELNPDYVKLAEDRLDMEARQPRLQFGD